MAADSNSQIAWHRAQIRKHRDALKQFETSRFTFGAIATPKATDQSQEIVAELKRKIRESEQIVAAYERQARRPLATDFQTLANAPWSKWIDRGPSSARWRRECRRPMRPIAACAGCVESHAFVRAHRNHPAFPAQWFYGL